MVSYFNRPARPGSTDEAAQRLLRMLEREELEAAELRRLKESGWQPPQQPVSRDSGDVAFSDGRDAIVDQVQAGLDYQNALRAEAQRRARAAATPAVWSAPSNGSLGADDPRLILIGDSKPAGGSARPAATPYEMTPALAQWMGLGMGAAGAALSMYGMDRAAHHWLNRRDHAVLQDVGDYPYPDSPRDRTLIPTEGSNAGGSTAQRTITGAPSEPVPGPSPESALAKLETLLRPTPSRYPDPTENWSIERLIPPEIARQDVQTGGYSEGFPVPKLEPLIREAWSPSLQELLDWLLSLNSKGSQETQRDVDYLAGRILEGLKARDITGGEHSHGGTSRKERYYPAEGNRKEGSGRSDLTITIGDKALSANTGVFLKDHKTPIADERGKGTKMSHLQTLQKDSPYPFLILPKRKGFTEEEWKETTDRMIDEFLTRIFWPVKK